MVTSKLSRITGNHCDPDAGSVATRTELLEGIWGRRSKAEVKRRNGA